MPIPLASVGTTFPARVRTYRENRSRFQPEQLLPFAGQWVAFSGDGKRIVAFDKELADLDAKLAALGLDPQEVWFEQVTDEIATGAQIG